MTQGGIALAPAQAKFSEPYKVETNQGNYTSPQPLPKKRVENYILSNCFAYVRTVFPSLPSMNVIQANATTTGTVAVFMYPPSAEFPNGTPHVAVVLKRYDDSVLIRESNYGKAAITERMVNLKDVHLKGFFTP